jgi:hypothetical protein
LTWHRAVCALPAPLRGEYAPAVPGLLREFLAGENRRALPLLAYWPDARNTPQKLGGSRPARRLFLFVAGTIPAL